MLRTMLLALAATAWFSRGDARGIGRRVVAFAVPLIVLIGSATGWLIGHYVYRAHHNFRMNPFDSNYAPTATAISEMTYKSTDGVITFVHTEVPPELGGRGIASKLIRGALDQVRADGLKVIAQCPFVKAFIEKNAAYQDLLKS